MSWLMDWRRALAPARLEPPSEPDVHAELVRQNCDLADRVVALKCELARMDNALALAGRENAQLRGQLSRSSTAREDQHRRNCQTLTDALALAEGRVGLAYAPLSDEKLTKRVLEAVRAAVKATLAEVLDEPIGGRR